MKPLRHNHAAHAYAWMLGILSLTFLSLLLLAVPDAHAGTWLNPGSATFTQGTIESSNIPMTAGIAGSPTTDAMLGVYIPPFTDGRTVVECVFTWNVLAGWYSGIQSLIWNGSSWGSSTELREEVAAISPCLPGPVFSWTGDFTTGTDVSANGTYPWQLMTIDKTSNNLMAFKYSGGSWTSEVVSNAAVRRSDPHVDVLGTNNLAIVVTNADNTLDAWTRSGVTNTWTDLGAPPISTTDAHGDVAWVNGEPWVVSRSDVSSKGQLNVHRYNGSSWVQVGAGPLNIDSVNGDVTSVAIANDANDHPYITWVESGSVYVDQWNGSSWTLLGGAAIGTGTSSDVVVHPRVNTPYVSYSGTASAGVNVKMWTGSTWLGPVTSKSGSTFPSTSIAIAKNQPWIAMGDGSLSEWSDRYTSATVNSPTASGGPAVLSGTTTPTLNLSGSFVGDTLGIYDANQWQVRLASGSYASPAWDSGWTSTGTSVTTPALPDGDYCYHVRWTDQQLTSSTYSSDYCGWMIDTTPPPAPATRNDGTGADIAWSNSDAQISANWSTSVDAMSGTKNYDYCVSTSATGGDCVGAATVPWTVNATTSVTKTGLALTQGTTYYVCVRARDNMNYLSTVVCTNGQTVDSIAPTAPTLLTPTASQYVIGSPASLTATYDDVAPGSPGDAFFQLCADAGCSSVLQSGWSAAGLAIGATASRAITALTTGTYYWRAYGRDSALNTSPYAATQSFTVNFVPSAPTALTPAPNAWVNSASPTFQGTFNDANDTGSVRFELCTTNAPAPWSANCGASYQTVDSATSIPVGSPGSAQFNVPLSDGSYYWHARNVDSYGEVSGWTSAQVVNVDTVAPSVPSIGSISPAGAGKERLSYSTSTDAGSGSVAYNVASSTDGGSTWPPACTATAAASCTATGLPDATQVLMRVQACDLAGNCTSWQYAAGATGRPYYLRTTQASTMATGAQQASTTAAGSGTTTSSVSYAANEWLNFKPTTSNTTGVTTEPANNPAAANGLGWIVDSVKGKSIAAGDLTVEYSQQSTTTSGVGEVQCRAWRVTTDGTNILSSTFLGKGTTGTDVFDGVSTTTHTCVPAVLTNQIALAGNESIYLELLAHNTAAGSGTIRLRADNTQSTLTTPGSGTFPDAPAPTAPVGGVVASLTPTLQATYSHPAPAVNGTVEFDLATDSGFTNIVQTGTSASVADGGTGSFAASTLAAGTTYYWRARAVDNAGLVSGDSAPQTFTTSTAPSKPTNAAPPSTSIVRTPTPTLTASAFSDVDPGDSQSRAQWQVRTSTGAYSNAVDDTTSAVDLTSHVVTPGLTNNRTYCWRVRYRDSFSVWSAWSTETCFTYDATGGSISVGLDSGSASFPHVLANDDATATTVATVSSLNATGYTLTATDASDAYGMSGASSVPDWSGTDATPTTWPAATGPFFGITVLGVSGSTSTKDPKWGTGTTASDFVNDNYAGVRNTSGVTLFGRSGFSTTPDVVTLAYRFDSGNAPAGGYVANITITATPNA